MLSARWLHFIGVSLGRSLLPLCPCTSQTLCGDALGNQVAQGSCSPSPRSPLPTLTCHSHPSPPPAESTFSRRVEGKAQNHFEETNSSSQNSSGECARDVTSPVTSEGQYYGVFWCVVGGELSSGIRDDGVCGEQKAFVSMDALLRLNFDPLSLVQGERNFLNPKLRHQFSQPRWIALRKPIAKLKITP